MPVSRKQKPCQRRHAVLARPCRHEHTPPASRATGPGGERPIRRFVHDERRHLTRAGQGRHTAVATPCNAVSRFSTPSGRRAARPEEGATA